jgi:hypothetical protein
MESIRSPCMISLQNYQVHQMFFRDCSTQYQILQSTNPDSFLNTTSLSHDLHCLYLYFEVPTKRPLTIQNDIRNIPKQHLSSNIQDVNYYWG